MITKAARSRLQSFVNDTKGLLTDFVKQSLQSSYGIWEDGTIRPIHDLPTDNTEIIHTARLLRQRIDHIKNTLPGEFEEDSAEDKKQTAKAIGQLIAEQAFTLLNRMAAVKMAGERGIIQPCIFGGFESVGFSQYDAVTGGGAVGTTFERYTWFIFSVFDELSIELPAVFNRYSPYGLIWFDEMTLIKFFNLINAEDLSAYYDTTNGETINFWQEDETLGWIFQYYNSLEERRKMREESTKPRNSREMAVRNQFFTPDYVVEFLTDNSLGRIWWEMAEGKSTAIEEKCEYLIHRPDEKFEKRKIKEPTELTLLDPTCGSMHFGLYAFGVFETVYMDAWDNHPELLQKYKYEMTREEFHRIVPKLILEHNIFGAEIDPRALQIAADSLWLRAQKSWEEQGVESAERPVIRKSNLVLAEPMPGNKKLLYQLTKEMNSPMQKLVKTVWKKMTIAGEAGLLLKMEKEIEADVADIKRNWHKYRVANEYVLELTEEDRENNEAVAREIERVKKLNKDEFFAELKDNLTKRITELSEQMSENEGYENALFSEDAAQGLSFIELCLRRFDVIVMNPPFGEGSEASSLYLDRNYDAWCKNLVCAFFDRMQEMLSEGGKLGAIFDISVLYRESYIDFRNKNIFGKIDVLADTGEGVLEANVETSTLVTTKEIVTKKANYFNVNKDAPEAKPILLRELISSRPNDNKRHFIHDSQLFRTLPNGIIGYNFNDDILSVFSMKNLETKNFRSREGLHFAIAEHYRLFYETRNNDCVIAINGAGHSLFYMTYRDIAFWNNQQKRVEAHKTFRSCSLDYLKAYGIGYGKRGEILDTHILPKECLFSGQCMAIHGQSKNRAIIVLSHTNSILSQYSINLYTGQHKRPGYVNLLPMPDYETRQEEIERIVNEIIEIKRHWFSLDETNLEYHGLIGQLEITNSLNEAIDRMQERLTRDYDRYQELVKSNDDLWMDLAEIDRDSDFRQTLNDYKARRPYEELLSIDKVSDKNIIDRKILTSEILQELVGIVFARWDMAYASGEATIPEFGDVFDPLPFMPVVEYKGAVGDFSDIFPQMPNLKIGISDSRSRYVPHETTTGIIFAGDRHNNLTDQVREAMSYLWDEHAADIEAEMTKLLGVDSLRDWFDSPNGFFDYHFMRYTKSRRKAPIYWPISTESGEIFCWIYYPTLNADTLKRVTLMIDEEIERLRSRLNQTSDTVVANRLNQKIDAMVNMKKEITNVIALPYVPNHDDGVPVTAAPLRNLFANRKWQKECEENWKKLSSGEYDWSHLAFSIRPAEVRNKARKDWCMALTHGLEEICENKPKEKKARKSKKEKEPKAGKIDFDFE